MNSRSAAFNSVPDTPVMKARVLMRVDLPSAGPGVKEMPVNSFG